MLSVMKKLYLADDDLYAQFFLPEKEGPSRRDNVLEEGGLNFVRKKRRERRGSLVDKKGKNCWSAAFWGWLKCRNVEKATNRIRQKELLRIEIVISNVRFSDRKNNYLFSRNTTRSHPWDEWWRIHEFISSWQVFLKKQLSFFLIAQKAKRNTAQIIIE